MVGFQEHHMYTRSHLSRTWYVVEQIGCTILWLKVRAAYLHPLIGMQLGGRELQFHSGTWSNTAKKCLHGIQLTCKSLCHIQNQPRALVLFTPSLVVDVTSLASYFLAFVCWSRQSQIEINHEETRVRSSCSVLDISQCNGHPVGIGQQKDTLFQIMSMTSVWAYSCTWEACFGLLFSYSCL